MDEVLLDKIEKKHRIELLSIIGEVEGHESATAQSKTTKYEHVIPQLVAIEESSEIEGLIIILNTVGGDIEAGLAIAELIAGMENQRYPLFLVEVTQSECRWRFQLRNPL